MTTFIFSLSGFKMLDAGEDQSEVLTRERRLEPEVIRTYRSDPIFEQGILRKLKRSFHNEDLGEEMKSYLLRNDIGEHKRGLREELKNDSKKLVVFNNYIWKMIKEYIEFLLMNL